MGPWGLKSAAAVFLAYFDAKIKKAGPYKYFSHPIQQNKRRAEPMNPDTVQIEASWKEVLYTEFAQPYFSEIRDFLVREKAAGKVIYPPGSLIFNAFWHTPFQSVKCVILGQDPYIKPGEARGLSFSVPRGVPVPPSLRNVYKELAADIPGFVAPAHGCLESWADQGVLLLNAALTVERGRSNSHAQIGWHRFTDAVIRLLSEKREGLVFMLWGNFAKQKAALIDSDKHLVLTAAHPSPLAGNAFLGCRHFSRANAYLSEKGKTPVDWRLG
jgi:uracil-DNA glycosylase